MSVLDSLLFVNVPVLLLCAAPFSDVGLEFAVPATFSADAFNACLYGLVGDVGRGSVGVGGVTSVVGVPTRFGGVAGAVTIVGFVAGAALGVEGAASFTVSLSNVALGKLSVEPVSLFAVELVRFRSFPPNSAARPPPPLPPFAILCESGSAALFFFGKVKTLLKLSTGDSFRSVGNWGEASVLVLDATYGSAEDSAEGTVPVGSSSLSGNSDVVAVCVLSRGEERVR